LSILPNKTNQFLIMAADELTPGGGQPTTRIEKEEMHGAWLKRLAKGFLFSAIVLLAGGRKVTIVLDSPKVFCRVARHHQCPDNRRI